MPADYNPKLVEHAWYDWWQKTGYFRPEFPSGSVPRNNPKGVFMICIPPPNVTGALHIGHALTNAIQDTLVRWNRMQGKTTLWVPGTDHAGIATQVVVEKKLMKEQGLSRQDLGREKFVSEVWKWKEQYGGRICSQLRRLGGSYDWSREVFTMDEPRSRAVTEAFVRLFQDKLIFRAVRLVNWECKLNSAISDVEVDSLDIQGPTMRPVPSHGGREYEFGTLTSFAYKIEDSAEEIVIATTRVETMLGDTGIAVNPQDVRYKHLIGKFAIHPFIPGRRLRIVGDEHAQMDVGTGAVKITPAHDFNDYEVGRRHNLPMINVFTDNGHINDVCPQFAGLPRFEARLKITAALKELGLFRKVDPNPMVVPLCSRTKEIIEPLLKPQWFCDCRIMAARALLAVKNGDLKIVPDSHEKTWNNWLENIRDWCISRQLWWGHRVPAWFVHIKGQARASDDNMNHWIVARSEDAAYVAAAARFGVPREQLTLEQDPDVLDTWFSSALFPFSVLGWPDNTTDLELFYPGALLETGHDILFFWVARMVFFGIHLLGKVPFKEVYLHAIVRDAHGRKMSKSLGNVVDPVDIIEGVTLEQLHAQLASGNLSAEEIERAREGQKADYPTGIPECGTDALRFALIAYTAQGKAINLDVNRVVGFRHFCNKLWNVLKFALFNLGAEFKPVKSTRDMRNLSDMDRWILSRLSSAITTCNKALASYEFPLFANTIYGFFLYDLCDVYLEVSKPVFQRGSDAAKDAARQALYTAIETGLRLLAPVMPFISEELWQRLPRRDGVTAESIHTTTYPETAEIADISAAFFVAVEDTVTVMQSVTHAARVLSTRYLTPRDRPTSTC
jgi:valyl-tRNA synthetase